MNTILSEELFNKKKVKPASIFHCFINYYYPIPSLERDKILKKINYCLNKNKIYSLGRFGSWQYESGNIDDCFEESRKIIKDLF